MTQRSHICGAIFIRLARLAGVGCLAGLAMPGTAFAGQTAAAEHQDVTYTKDIAPILQRRCQTCHRPDSVAPMSLLTYQQARPWARAMKMRTGVGPRAGVMPPWYLEHDIGIQRYKNDPSLSEEEIAKIAAWADNGAPEGNPVDLPEPIDWNTSAWSIGEPDLITVLPDITMKGTAPDWWGEIETTPVGITEDRYVAALEFKEINDVDLAAQSRDTVGGRFIYHHMIWSTQVVGDDVEQDDQRERGTAKKTFSPKLSGGTLESSALGSKSVSRSASGCFQLRSKSLRCKYANQLARAGRLRTHCRKRAATPSTPTVIGPSCSSTRWSW